MFRCGGGEGAKRLTKLENHPTGVAWRGVVRCRRWTLTSFKDSVSHLVSLVSRFAGGLCAAAVQANMFCGRKMVDQSSLSIEIS